MGNNFRPSQGTKKTKHISPDVRTAQADSTNHEHPIFDLQRLEGRSCVTKCSTQLQADFALTIHKLSKMTWQQIQGAQRHGLGTEKIAKFGLREDLKHKLTEDQEYLLAFRFSGKTPFLGYRIDRIFVVLCLDFDFSAYDHG